MRLILRAVIWGVLVAPLAAQNWQIPFRHQNIVLDGYLDDWTGVPQLVLEPGRPGVRSEGEFGEGDVRVTIQALWDEQNLYVAVTWQDDQWDIGEVRRRDAVFVAPDRSRRDRMLFFDNLKLQIRELEFDYLLWVSPRVNDRGPYSWHRRLMGKNVREAATRDPAITPRQYDDGHVTLEMLFEWKELELKPKRLLKKGLPFSVLVADSDRPGSILESKLNTLKQLQWNGTVSLGQR